MALTVPHARSTTARPTASSASPHVLASARQSRTNRYLASSADISTHGAKVRTRARLKTGPAAQLELVPPEGPPLRVGALVWRVTAARAGALLSRAEQSRPTGR